MRQLVCCDALLSGGRISAQIARKNAVLADVCVMAHVPLHVPFIYRFKVAYFTANLLHRVVFHMSPKSIFDVMRIRTKRAVEYLHMAVLLTHMIEQCRTQQRLETPANGAFEHFRCGRCSEQRGRGRLFCLPAVIGGEFFHLRAPLDQIQCRHLMDEFHVTRHFVRMLASVIAHQAIVDGEHLAVHALTVLQICTWIVRIAIALTAMVFSVQFALRERMVRVVGLIVVHHQLLPNGRLATGCGLGTVYRWFRHLLLFC